MRRLARLADVPPDGQPLILALAQKRLLLTDKREHETVVEVAHEALLRHWPRLFEWLSVEREDLKQADALERAAEAWQANDCRESWLLTGERLSNAEALAGKRGYEKRLDACRDFLRASRGREDAARAEEDRRRQAELEAAQRLAAEQ